jgi:predicted transcriptional regulator
MAATKVKARQLVTFQIDRNVTDKLRSLAAASDVSVSYLIRKAIKEKYEIINS